jgi:hypothetical protein
MGQREGGYLWSLGHLCKDTVATSSANSPLRCCVSVRGSP